MCTAKWMRHNLDLLLWNGKLLASWFIYLIDLNQAHPTGIPVRNGRIIAHQMKSKKHSVMKSFQTGKTHIFKRTINCIIKTRWLIKGTA